MWLLSAFLSAALLGLYDVFKKQSLKNNAVIPVLFLNTLFSSLIFLSLMLFSAVQPETLKNTIIYIPAVDWEVHKYVILKSFIVLSSWIFGYFGMKHLPLTIVGPINTTRPVMVLMGALFFFGEHLNSYQWIGVLLAVMSFFLLSKSGKKEGIDFGRNKWIYFIVLASMLGAASGLYDKYLMASVDDGGIGLDRMFVQSWYNIYQLIMMGAVLGLLWYPKRKYTTPFHWDWCIVGVSFFLTLADFVYFYSLSLDGAMISIISMIRRSSVMVSFLFGVIIFRENNYKSKLLDLILLFIGLVFLYLGSE